MCAVNDKKRADYNEKIRQLKNEYESENNKYKDIYRARSQIQQLSDKIQCVINNISECNFGGNKILSSIKLSEKGYNERIDFYNEYIKKCLIAIEDIKQEIDETIMSRNNLPKNCGHCPQCSSKVNDDSLEGV